MLLATSLPILLLLPLLTTRAEATWLGDAAALIRDCPQVQRHRERPLAQLLGDCARRRALAAIDRIIQHDTIPILDGLQLVNCSCSAEDSPRRHDDATSLDLRDLLKRIRERDGGLEGGEDEEGGWLGEKLTKRLARVLKTHAIKIDLERSTGVTSSSARSTGLQIEPRGRRRRRRQMQMMPIIMMGVLLMGSVLIPMGFQFLAVLGGKALILAKMALMLSSIQGLKKIATNGVNYGLYHSPVPEAWHERSTAGGLELPSYALSYANGYSHAPAASVGSSASYLEPANGGFASYFTTNRRSATN